MKLLIASSNKGKVQEFQSLLPPEWEILSLSDERFKKITRPEVPETGDTYFENALVKAVSYYGAYKVPVLADDSGLEVDALNERPGVHSARYGGDSLTFPERCGKILGELATIPQPRWTARFRCV